MQKVDGLMARFYIGCTGHNFAIVDLPATNPVDALEELRRKEQHGWVTFEFADSADSGAMKFDSIVMVKRYSGRFTHKKQGS
jgi:hypothetical protein